MCPDLSSHVLPSLLFNFPPLSFSFSLSLHPFLSFFVSFPGRPFLFSLFPLGWREALPPQLCHMCPLPHDVSWRRRNVPYRWGKKKKKETIKHSYKKTGFYCFKTAEHCRYPDGRSVFVCLCVTKSRLETSIQSPDKWVLQTIHSF